jgi:hypothetical protein
LYVAYLDHLVTFGCPHSEGSGKFTTQKAEFLIMAYFKKVHPMLQLVIFAGMAMGCFMIFGFIGTFVLAKATGIDLITISDPDKWDYANPSLLTFLRGMLVIQFFALYIIPVFLFARLCDPKPTQYLGLTSAKPIYFILGNVLLVLFLSLIGQAQLTIN